MEMLNSGERKKVEQFIIVLEDVASLQVTQKDAKAYEEGESDEEPDYDRFFEELSKVIKKGDACVIIYAGHEKLGYISGNVIVITKDHVEYDSLENRAREIMKDNGVDPSSVDMYY